jgi:hypothetical protein
MATLAKRRLRQVRAHGPHRRAWAAALLVLALVGIGVVWLSVPETPATGSLSAPQLRHDFGEAGIRDGLLTTQLPLDVRGTVRVTTLESS